jgi:hypothetical protein
MNALPGDAGQPPSSAGILVDWAPPPARVNADDLDRESLGVVRKTAIAF